MPTQIKITRPGCAGHPLRVWERSRTQTGRVGARHLETHPEWFGTSHAKLSAQRTAARERFDEVPIMRSLVRPCSSAVERVEQFHAEIPEVANVPRRHRQSVHSRRGRDHGVLDQGV